MPDSRLENITERIGQEQLFERFAILRRQIASAAGFLSYIIFYDSTLTEMLLPKDMQEMKAVQDIGEVKLTEYGQRFLNTIWEHILPGQQS